MRVKILGLMATLVLVAGCGGNASSGTAEDAMANIDVNNIKPGSQEDLVVNVGDRIFFDLDRSGLRPDAIETLNSQADWLKTYPSVRTKIEGHADERGTREYNLALAERRASSAKQYLESMGIGSSRMETISYGKERPAVLGSNEAAWAQNRRAVMVVTGGASS